MKRFIAVSFIIYVMVNQSYAQNHPKKEHKCKPNG